MVEDVSLLQEQIANVPFVAEHVVKGNGRPFAAISGRDACFIQFFADCRKPLAIQVRFEDAFDYSRFFRDDLQLPVDPFVAITAEERRLTIFEFLADRPLAVFRNGKALFLREGCEDGQHQFTIGTDGVDVLFLKVDIDTERFQFSHRGKQDDRVAGEAADRLGDNHVDFSGSAVIKEPLKISAVVFGTGGCFICVNANILPAAVGLDQAAVLADLCG